MRRGNRRLGLVMVAIAAVACAGESEESGDAAVARGEKIYRNVCVVCHNADPNLADSLGPEIAIASRELLEAKLLRGEYPADYTPKRNTQQMPRFEYLEPNLDDIAAFLANRGVEIRPPGPCRQTGPARSWRRKVNPKGSRVSEAGRAEARRARPSR